MNEHEIPNNEILQKIDSPEDLQKLSSKELGRLCAEIRELLIETVSTNGGHLASNLGVVELTVALHRVFSSPLDQIVFDVGHQCYTHKILTGRRGSFSSLRKEGGISGFPKPNESPHDILIAGHSSTSVSSALGLAKAKRLGGDEHHVIAVIGDGALTGGLSYEGLNNVGRSRENLIVVLNDNKMSINKNVGAMARYLAVIRTKSTYIKFKAAMVKIFGAIPFVGKRINKLLFRSKYALKNAIYKKYRSTLFEDMGLVYIGPVDGHNVKLMERTLRIAKELKRPVLIHACTLKGKGYSYAERKPKAFHGIGAFDIETGELKFSADTYSDIFGKEIVKLAREDESICAVTAAMKSGTALEKFAEQFRRRFFDVGIAEAHAVTFSAGLAANGLKPVFVVYSSFIQRAYDQIIHDVAIQNLNVTFVIDRAGIVGEDGETHNGIFDVAMLSNIPNMVIYSPAYFSEVAFALKTAVDNDGPAVIRYPRGVEPSHRIGHADLPSDYELVGEGGGILVVTYGRLSGFAVEMMNKLRKEGVDVSVLRLFKIYPLGEQCISSALGFAKILFFEEGIKSGGIGEKFACLLLQRGYKGKFILRAVEDRFIPHASTSSVLARLGLDEEGMTSLVRSESDN
ncbi:MAG: 1-deoxy-D-xylulose-5-phosphate synthase [Oscillospiraceae bacterium]|jgi:1-deoxy-D-xylulose-5-phosphate synthase|nr:1-deoxy-D-xylulose-5-phosphate synthase [Oscillospiraceae bacterium]